ATCRSGPRSPRCWSWRASRSSPTPRRRPLPSSCSRSPSSRSSRSISSNAGASDTMAEPRAVTHLRAHDDPPAVKAALILAAVAVMAFFVVVPLVNVFVQAFAGGVGVYWRNLVADADTLHSIKLTLIVAPIAVGSNLVFGIAAAWAIARFHFPGRTLLTALIDLPFTVSPVVVGLFLLLLFGLQGTFGPWLRAHDLKIVFALPGLVLATAFVTFPVVALALVTLFAKTALEWKTRRDLAEAERLRSNTSTPPARS